MGMVAGENSVTQPLSESEFEALAESALAALERAFERVIEAGALDADLERKGDGVLEIEFANGTKMVINRHGAAREIWVAAKSGGFHFRHDGAAWRDTRDGGELFAAVSRLASAQSGTAVLLAAS
jgi:CyaY protein